MSARAFDVLALGGSLRRASSNTALLQAAERLAPVALRVERREGIGKLPPFDPDRESMVRDERGRAHVEADDDERPDLDAAAIVADAALRDSIRGALDAFASALHERSGREGDPSRASG